MSDSTITQEIFDEINQPTDEYSQAPDAARPRVRIGAVVWGLIVCIVAASTIAVAVDPARSTAVIDWISELTGPTIGLITLISAGSILLLLGLVSLLRQAQRRGERV